MNIGFDAVAVFSHTSRNRGIGNYSVSLFQNMIGQDKENNYFMLNCIDSTSFKSYLDADTENFSETTLYMGKNNYLHPEFSHNDDFSDIYGDIIKSFIEKNKIDVFIVTSPFDLDYGKSMKKEWFDGVQTVAVVYDIIPYIFKNIYLTNADYLRDYTERAEALRLFDKLLVISQSVKDDLIKYMGFDGDKIDVIFGAADSYFKEIQISDQEKKDLFDKFGIQGDYIMCTGGDDGRKNIEGLILAYAKLPRDLTDKYQLVVVCKLGEQTKERYYKLASDNGIEGRLVLTDFVSLEELIQFYNLAHLMAFPSKYEGFGLPIVEAWACGTPVLTSNNSSLVQIGGNGAVIVDPFDINDITKGLRYALSEADLPDLLRKGKEELKKYTWEKVASYARESIQKLKLHAKEAADIEDNHVTPKNKIAIFTPLPPIKSGISDYSLDIIYEMSKYFDIDVFVDGYSHDCPLPDGVNVYTHKLYKQNRNNYYDTIYHIGNSEYHIYMFDYLEKYRGTVVLHDFNLHGVALFLRSKNKEAFYRKALKYDYKEKEAKNILSGNVDYSKFPINGFVTDNADKIIVHDNWSKKRLLENSLGRNITVIPHYAKTEEIVDKNTFREKFGFSEGDIIFATFGFVHFTKRAVPLMKAFARFCKENEKAKLLYVGKPLDNIDKELTSLSQSLGIKDRVTIIGYTALEDFLNYIDICDVCFNLRYPYNGESSGSLARILAKQKCVVVNRIGSFDSVPDEACVKLDSVENLTEEQEIEAILGVMRGYISHPDKFEKIAENARRYAAENLDLVKLGQEYRDAILSSARKSLNHKNITNAIISEVSKNHYSSKECKDLAHTLAYAKNC